MKKNYITPAVDIYAAQTEQMMALSLQGGAADDSEVLTKGDNAWDIWSEDDIDE